MPRRVVATSREGLAIPGETVRPVPSLSVPDPDAVGADGSQTLRVCCAASMFAPSTTTLVDKRVCSSDVPARAMSSTPP